MTARELVEIWPSRWPRPEPQTTANCAGRLKHFAAFFGDTELEDIRSSDFRRFAVAHPGAARYARTALADALDDGIIDSNVAAGVAIPRLPKREVVVPTVKDVERLVEEAKRIDSIFAAMIEFSAYTGLREGEARALTRADVFTGIGRGRVEWSLTRDGRRKEPKTPASKAPFALIGPSLNIAASRQRHSHHCLFPFTHAQRAHLWLRVRYEAELDRVKWHGLRHFTATYLLDRGATVDDVALQLRCTADEIRKTYGHPDREAALGRIAAL